MGERFQIVFCGEVSDDISRAQARENIGKLFRNSGGALPDFFDGKRYVLKRNLDRQAAENCRQQLLGHGLVCKIARMQADTERVATVAPDSQPETIVCPNCRHKQVKQDDCAQCGIVFAKFNRQERDHSPPPGPVFGGRTEAAAEKRSFDECG